MLPGVVGCRRVSTGRMARGSEGLAVSDYVYGTLAVSQPRQWVVEVKLNRPEKRNAMNQDFWRCASFSIAVDTDCSVLGIEKW